MARSRKTNPRRRLTRVEAEGDVREQIDWDRLAWALFQYARILVENEDQGDSAP
jgi:hypothetical protein